jgi:hypothetical protein
LELPPYHFHPLKPHIQIHLPVTDYLGGKPKLDYNNPIGGNVKPRDNNQTSGNLKSRNKNHTGGKLYLGDNNQTGAKFNLEGNNPTRGITKHKEPTRNLLLETNYPP